MRAPKGGVIKEQCDRYTLRQCMRLFYEANLPDGFMMLCTNYGAGLKVTLVNLDAVGREPLDEALAAIESTGSCEGMIRIK